MPILDICVKCVPHTDHLISLLKAIKTINMQIKRLNTKVKKLMKFKVCVIVDSSLSSDIQRVIDDHKYRKVMISNGFFGNNRLGSILYTVADLGFLKGVSENWYS